MRLVGLALLTLLVTGGAAIAGDAAGPGDGAEAATGPGAQDLSGVTFNLAAPAFGKVERLPDAAQLRDLSLETGNGPVASAAPRPTARSAAKRSVKAAPKPKPAAVAVSVPALGPDGKPISAWRRAYILQHGRQPPAPR